VVSRGGSGDQFANVFSREIFRHQSGSSKRFLMHEALSVERFLELCGAVLVVVGPITLLLGSYVKGQIQIAVTNQHLTVQKHFVTREELLGRLKLMEKKWTDTE
jgi:hypothetical protein